MPWRVPGPRAGQCWVQSPFGAFRSPAGGIDPASSIRVMHGAGSGAEPGTNVPSGKGMGRQSRHGLAENPGAACGSCQARLAPSARGHSSRTQELPYSCWCTRCFRRVPRCPELLCSGHRAALPLPQLLAAHEATVCHDGGDRGVPHVPSCFKPPCSGSPHGAAVHPAWPTLTRRCLSKGIPPLFPTPPGPAHGIFQLCEPWAASVKPFAPGWVGALSLLLCSTGLIATTACAFAIPVPWVPPGQLTSGRVLAGF